MLEERASGSYYTGGSGGSRADVEAEVSESNAAPVDKLLLFIKYGQIMKLSCSSLTPNVDIKNAIKKGRGKTVTLQAWSGPEGCRKLILQDFIKTAQDGGKVVSLTHRPPLPPGNTPVKNAIRFVLLQ